jgi:hypothetical protein
MPAKNPTRAAFSRQLKYRRPLARAQACQQNDLAAREFERVVMLIGIVEIDLSEPRRVFPQLQTS